jgi:thiol:disulfide interchange protein DsbD
VLKRFCLPPIFAWLLAIAPVFAQELLEPEQAFRLSARARDAQTVDVRFEIADGYYLYRNKFRFSAEPPEVALGTPQLPRGEIKKDEFFGEVETFRREVRIGLPLTAPAGARELKLTVVSQGCADIGVCYPPTPQSIQVSLSPAAPASAPGTEAPGGADESSQVARLLRHAGFWLVISTFFGFGVLLTFTPCVLPMVPIISGIVVGHGHHISRGHALRLTLAYVLGMAVTYAAAGVAAGLSGTLISAALQNPWVLSVFAAIFVLLALSMFGFYELQLPSSLQSRISETASHRKSGSILGVTAMGALSALVVGPCVAAPLAGALLYIAQTGDAALGGAALFAMGLGMGVPLILVGVSARTLLPKSGPWMEAVKKFFGVALLAVAIWIVSPVIPPLAQMLAWAALLILSAIYLHALDPLPASARGWHRFWKGVGVVALLTGASLLIGALAGSRDPLQPLAILRGAATDADSPVRFERVRSRDELETRLRTAGRTVMLDFYADWCVSCKEFERFTFSDPAVRDRLAKMQLLQVDVTENTDEDQALLKRFGLFGPPGIVFFDPAGQEIPGIKVVGFQPPERFAEVLDLALRSAIVKTSRRSL